jgi:hypothetical protein
MADAAGPSALAQALGSLDQALSWLWRVHGVDYYGGRELTGQTEWDGRLLACRTLRGPAPEDGEGGWRAGWGARWAGGRAAGRVGARRSCGPLPGGWRGGVLL